MSGSGVSDRIRRSYLPLTTISNKSRLELEELCKNTPDDELLEARKTTSILDAPSSSIRLKTYSDLRDSGVSAQIAGIGLRGSTDHEEFVGRGLHILAKTTPVEAVTGDSLRDLTGPVIYPENPCKEIALRSEHDTARLLVKTDPIDAASFHLHKSPSLLGLEDTTFLSGSFRDSDISALTSDSCRPNSTEYDQIVGGGLRSLIHDTSALIQTRVSAEASLMVGAITESSLQASTRLSVYSENLRKEIGLSIEDDTGTLLVKMDPITEASFHLHKSPSLSGLEDTTYLSGGSRDSDISALTSGSCRPGSTEYDQIVGGGLHTLINDTSAHMDQMRVSAETSLMVRAVTESPLQASTGLGLYSEDLRKEIGLGIEDDTGRLLVKTDPIEAASFHLHKSPSLSGLEDTTFLSGGSRDSDISALTSGPCRPGSTEYDQIVGGGLHSLIHDTSALMDQTRVSAETSLMVGTVRESPLRAYTGIGLSFEDDSVRGQLHALIGAIHTADVVLPKSNWILGAEKTNVRSCSATLDYDVSVRSSISPLGTSFGLESETKLYQAFDYDANRLNLLVERENPARSPNEELTRRCIDLIEAAMTFDGRLGRRFFNRSSQIPTYTARLPRVVVTDADACDNFVLLAYKIFVQGLEQEYKKRFGARVQVIEDVLVLRTHTAHDKSNDTSSTRRRKFFSRLDEVFYRRCGESYPGDLDSWLLLQESVLDDLFALIKDLAHL